MESTNFRNITFLILLLVVLGAIFSYLALSKYTDSSIYASLFYQKED